eukprot:gene11827-14467_t
MSNIHVILEDLVKLVIRAFYPDEASIVIDALLREKRRVRDEDLALKLQVPQKQIRKVLQDLKGDSMVKSYDFKPEPKPNERATTQVLWYLDYKHFIAIVKYKLYMIRKKMEVEKSQKIDVQTYKCQGCSKIYSALDIPKLITMTGDVICEVCESGLSEENNNESLTQTTKHQADLLAQLKKIVEQLKKTEGVDIPLFARDTVTINPQSTNLNTINTNSNVSVAKSSAFGPTNLASQNGQNINPSSENIEFFVEIFDTDNIENISTPTVNNKENKKTGLASLPPWLLPSTFKNQITGGKLNPITTSPTIKSVFI